MSTNPYISMVYKVDWLALTISDTLDQNSETFELLLLENLGYDLADFESIPGRYFYNSGLTLGGYVNVYYNSKEKEVHRNSSMSRNYVFTGQGCTDLGQKINNDWVGLFEVLTKLGVKVTRIDLALDDYKAVLDFDKMEQKLKRGEYRSSKKSYNVIKEADVNGDIKGYTIYIGSRSRSANGCYFLRCYDKYAQYKSKAQLPPEEAIKSGKWQRYEISYTKKKAQKIVSKIVEDGQSISSVYMETARDIVEFLVKNKNQKNKSRWKVCKWWNDFLDGAEKARLGDPEKDVDLGRMLRWLRISVLPALHLMDEIFSEQGIDFFEVLKDTEIADYSKKQKRLMNNSKRLTKAELVPYLEEFKEGRYG